MNDFCSFTWAECRSWWYKFELNNFASVLFLISNNECLVEAGAKDLFGENIFPTSGKSLSSFVIFCIHLTVDRYKILKFYISRCWNLECLFLNFHFYMEYWLCLLLFLVQQHHFYCNSNKNRLFFFSLSGESSNRQVCLCNFFFKGIVFRIEYI